MNTFILYDPTSSRRAKELDEAEARAHAARAIHLRRKQLTSSPPARRQGTPGQVPKTKVVYRKTPSPDWTVEAVAGRRSSSSPGKQNGKRNDSPTPCVVQKTD